MGDSKVWGHNAGITLWHEITFARSYYYVRISCFITQASSYEACDCTRTPPHMPKFT